MNGTYVHKWIFEHVLHHVDVDYALTVAYLIDLIDREIRLRNITLKQKISEQSNQISQLETNYINSNKVKLHDKKSSIVISKSNRGSQNCYLINFKEADVSRNPMYQDDIVIGSVFNKSDLQNLFVFYVKTGELDFIKLISGMMYEIYDMEKVTRFINDTIGYGEYLVDDLLILHNERFETDYTVYTFTRRFSDMFEHENKKQVNGKMSTVLNLIKPDRLDVYKQHYS